ncbi:flagellar hook protein FlgE [Selenomonas ruminantium]|uniref:Flagellar hook protein FlgE n=1 Tax=Selenomonas ruminantium TaxID=971 RepID=A0A1K1PZE8_SELRU|nr:flagellar hook protein FlgE [Selenomonas ruminantium]SFW53000.1 flagellar hook protein FlgE [Selenomonas ruminantium]
MMRSLFSGVSGLKGHQTRMDVIGNNIANVNATGFKSSRVTFADTLSQTQTAASAPGDTLGGTNPKQIGLGTGVASIDLLFTDGSAQQTGKNTDVALSGNGLFVVKSGNDTYYTRDGAFEFDAEGNYVLPGSGHYVQGWMAKDGVLTTNGGVENIVVKAGKSMAAKASEKITYENNLNSAVLTIKSTSGGTAISTASSTSSIKMSTPLNNLTFSGGSIPNDSTTQYTIRAISGGTTSGTNTEASPTDPVRVTLSDGSNTYTLTATSGTYVTSSVTEGTTKSTYSSGGTLSNTVTASTTNPVTLTMSDGSTVTQTSGSYTKGYSLPITTTVNVYDTLGNVHTLNLFFTKTKVDSSSGNEWTLSLDSDITKTTTTITEDDGSITTLTLDPVTINFTTSGKYNSGTGATTLTLTNGAMGTQNVAIDLSTLTQYAGNNTVKGEANGNAAGTLKSVSIDQSGIITGVYTNGVRQSEAQIAIAQFSNASGLTKTGSSLYQESNNSGTPNVKTAADLGVTITPSALEMSNVDIANEFSDMIITQRGFQSNSKVITVGDEMLETLINMKR